MRSPVRALVVTALAALALSACAPSTPEEVGASLATVADGFLTACVAPTPRLVVEAPDTPKGWDGFDIAVLEHVAQTLALPLRLEVVSYDGLVSGVVLNDRTCDIGAGGIVSSEDLHILLDLSVPYRNVDRLVLAPAAAALVAASPADLAGVRIGYEEAGPAADVLDDLAGVVLVSYPSATDLNRAFAGGDVAAVLVAAADVATVRASVADASVVLRVPTAEVTVLALAKGVDPAVLEAVNDAIAVFLASPEHAAMVTEWLEN